MHSYRDGTIGAALVAVLAVISLTPLGLSYWLYLALVLIASMLTGLMIGRRSAAYLVLVSMIAITAVSEIAVNYLFRIEPHTNQHLRVATFGLLNALLATFAAALGVWLRRREPPTRPLASN
jgi:hypothetical protein